MPNSTNKDIIAGFFVFISLISIVVVIFTLGSKTGIAESKFYKEVVFSDVGGLSVGAPVRVAGVNVGSVVEIEFLKKPIGYNKRVKVTLSIFSKYKSDVEQCSVYAIKTEGLLGDKLVDIQLPKEETDSRIFKVGDYIIGQDPLDIRNLADDFSQTTKYFSDLSQKMTALADNLQIFVKTSKRTLDRLEDKIIEGGLFSLFMGGK